MDPVQIPSFTQKVQPMSSDSDFNFKKYGLIALGIVVLIIYWVWIDNPMVVTVTGKGEVAVAATTATVSFTISASDGNPQNAINAVQAKAAAITDVLKNNGVAEGDIVQSQVNAAPGALITQGGSGYQAIISMSAKTVHISDLGNLVSTLYANGVLVVSQPILSVDNQEVLENRAFNDAMKAADKQAWNIGLSKWKFIKKIVSISQITSPNTSTSTTKADTLTQANNQIAAENGVFKIIKAVSVSYKLW